MNQRFYALDLLRGLTIAFMILVNNAGNWEFIYTPLEHAPWHGCTPTDLVFPFFLFVVGCSMAFVFPKLEAAGQSAFLRKIIYRALIIFGIGLFLNWSPFVRWQDDHLAFRHWVNPNDPSSGVRILGVLQRIALCYLFASLIIYYFKMRGAFFIGVILLLGYWLICLLAGSGDHFSIDGYFGTYLDKTILGIPHMYKGEGVAFDPEGIASTMPAIAQVILGYLAGSYILQKGINYEMLSKLFVTGCVLVFLGYCWDMSFPINKKIWTSSFVVYTSGLAILLLCVLIYCTEFRKSQGKWSDAFVIFGKNPLFIFFLSGFLPRILGLLRWKDGVNEKGEPVYTSVFPWFYEHVCKGLSADLRLGSFVYALCVVLFFWLIAFWMDRKKIYVRV